jgi:hypothetical protein
MSRDIRTNDVFNSSGTWPVLDEFYHDYIAVWLGPILEFTFLQQHHVNSWILAQYGLTRQEVEGVPELVANSLSARLSARRIRLPSRIRGSRETL